MNSDVVQQLFFSMVSYANSIYENILSLCELENAGKKQECAYYNTLKNLRQLIIEEREFYYENIDKIIANRGELFFLLVINSNDVDKTRFDFLCNFDPNCIYERIKTKLKYHIGLRRSFDGDILNQLKISSNSNRIISGTLLEESIKSDIEKISLLYMDTDCYDKKRKTEYKYLMALISNIDAELLDNYFEVLNNKAYVDSALVYSLSGIPKEIYTNDFTTALISEFNDYVDYIINERLSDCEIDDYKIEMILNYLKSILDLLPLYAKEEFFNEYIMSISDDNKIPSDIKIRIMNAMRNASKKRDAVRQIRVGFSKSWIE